MWLEDGKPMGGGVGGGSRTAGIPGQGLEILCLRPCPLKPALAPELRENFYPVAPPTASFFLPYFTHPALLPWLPP